MDALQHVCNGFSQPLQGHVKPRRKYDNKVVLYVCRPCGLREFVIPTSTAINSILAEAISKVGERQRSNFPVISHEDSEGRWNVGLPFLL